MKSVLRLKPTVAMLLFAPLAGCAHIGITNDVPYCERLVPPALKRPVPAADLPAPAKHADGHQDAQPWMESFVVQTGQLDKANDRGDAIDHIYRVCVEMHRNALRKATKRGIFSRIFGS